MSITQKEEVLKLLGNVTEMFGKATPMERLKHIIGASIIFSKQEGYARAIKLSKEFYEAAIVQDDWEDVLCLVNHFSEVSIKLNNEALKWIVLGLLDVLEYDRQEEEIKLEKAKLVENALQSKLTFSSSKGKTLKEVYIQAGSKQQFEVILKFLIDHPRCDENLRKTSLLLMENIELI